MEDELLSQADMDRLFPDDGDECHLISVVCKKVSLFNTSADKICVLSTEKIYIIDKKNADIKPIKIDQLKYIVKGNGNTSVLLYFITETDLLLQMNNQKDLADFLDMLKMRYHNICPKIHLKVFGVPPATMRDYRPMANTKGKKNVFAFDNEPASIYRLKKEEISTQKEVELEKTDGSQEESEFEFDGRASITLVSNKNREKIELKGDLDDESQFDNLADHLQDLILEDDSNKQTIDSVITNKDKNEMRETTLVKNKNNSEKDVVFEDFKILMVIGRGTFGKVFLAELKQNQQLYAIKSIRKDILIQYDQVENTILEKNIMFECEHEFLVGMEYLFQNELRLYFVMPFIRGGELYKVFQQQKRFKEELVKFYSAQLIIAIGYLHQRGIVHRDLKLENILLDQDGYLKIIDYGLAKILDGEQQLTTYTFCGTPEYLAPEMVNQTGHDKAVDWWALGVLMYEMLIGVTPFFNKNKKTLLEKISTSKVVFPDRKKYKIEYSDQIMELITHLLQKDKTNRLGSKDDFFEILSHPYFEDINIEALEKKQIPPPFMPNFGTKNLSEFFNVQDTKQAIDNTYVPRGNREIVMQQSDAFDRFNLKTKK